MSHVAKEHLEDEEALNVQITSTPTSEKSGIHDSFVLIESMLDNILLEGYYKQIHDCREYSSDMLLATVVASASECLGMCSPTSSWFHTQLTVLYISLKYI